MQIVSTAGLFFRVFYREFCCSFRAGPAPGISQRAHGADQGSAGGLSARALADLVLLLLLHESLPNFLKAFLV